MCVWEMVDKNWTTGCGKAHRFTEGDTWDNDFKFCPFCSETLYKRLVPREYPLHCNQTIFSEGKHRGNCLPACIVSLYRIEIGEIPNFAEQGEYWYPYFKKWLLNSGLSLRRVDLFGEQADIEQQVTELGLGGEYFIVTGRSPRNPKVDHAVVCNKKGAIINDPHPDCLGLDTFENLLVLRSHQDSSPEDSSK